MKRKYQIENGSIHHVYSRSIYKFVIFNSDEDYQRMQALIRYYKFTEIPIPYSLFSRMSEAQKDAYFKRILLTNNHFPLIDILSYCLMPTHVHFLLKQRSDKGIEIFIGKVFNAYSKYFNYKYNRKGPLWEHRFGNKPICDDAYLQHVMTYIQNNPVEANLTSSPSQWPYTFVNPGG